MHSPQNTELCCICCGHFMSFFSPHMVLELCRKHDCFVPWHSSPVCDPKVFIASGRQNSYTKKATREHCTLFQLFQTFLLTVFPRCLIELYGFILTSATYFLCILTCIYSKQCATPFVSLQGRQYNFFLVWRIHLLLTITQPWNGCDTWICSPCASGFSLCLSVFPSVCLKTNQPPSHPRTTYAHLRCLPALLVWTTAAETFI